jgi:hypothetical protein
MMKVFVLWHVHTLGTVDDEKLIGIYSDEGAAQKAIARLVTRPGFKECPDGFSIDSYEIDKDHWIEGYATV